MRLAAAVVLTLATPLAAQGWADQQHSDGHWPGVARGAAGFSDLHATGAAVLAALHEGSTLKEGPHREALRFAAMWLREQLDDAGSFGGGTLEDMALASHALALCHSLSAYRTLRPHARLAVAHVRRRMESDERPAVTSATRALTVLAMEALQDDDGRNAVMALGLNVVRDAAESPFARDAAELVLRALQAPDLVAVRHRPLIDRLLAFDLRADELRDDDLSVFLVTTALVRVGGPAWTTWSAKVRALDAAGPDASAPAVTRSALRAATTALLARGRALGPLPDPPAPAPEPAPVETDGKK